MARDESSEGKNELNILAEISHEMRTPMNAMLGEIQIMLADELPERQRGRLERIRVAASKMSSMIGDILDLSRAEAGRLRLERRPFDLLRVVDEVVGLFRPLAEKKGLRLQLDTGEQVPQYVRGDARRLSQILENLLDNAIKYTDEGSVSLGVESATTGETRRDGSPGPISLLFRVSDTGHGIPHDRQREIFKSFRRGEEEAGSSSGFGLGLSICRELVNMLGGYIWLQSKPGEGTTFLFTVTLEPAEADEVESAPEGGGAIDLRPDGRSLRVLLAEDDEMSRMFLSDYLTSRGHYVETATDGRQAVARLEDCDYDLVVMDVKMPHMDGIEATRRIRQGRTKEANRKMAIIGLSAKVDDESRRRALDAGMDAYMVKPVDLANFQAKLQDLTSLGVREADEDVSRRECAPGGKPEEEPEGVETPDAAEAAASGGDNGEDLPPTLDEGGVLKQYKGKKELFLRMVDAFSEQCDEKLGVIGQALEEGDMEKAEDEAHSLKGASRLLGAEALGELARTMEDSAREGRKDEARGAFDRAMREANTALKAMKDFTDQLE